MKRRAYIRLINERLWQDLLAGVDPASFTEWPGQLQLEWTLRPDAGGGSVHRTTPDLLRAALEQVDPGLFDVAPVLLMGGENTFTTMVNIPSKQSRYIAQALPFMLEDQLAEDVDSFEYVPGKRDKDGNVAVVACNKALLNTLVNLFRHHGVALDAVVPDMLAIPAHEGHWTFFCDGRTLSLRTGTLQGMSIEMDALPVLVKSLAREGSALPQRIDVVLAHGQVSDNLRSWLSTQFASMVAGTEVTVETSDVEGERLAILADFLTAANQLPINLLQGDLKAMPRRRAGGISWKPTAVLAGVLALMQTTYLYAQSWQYRSELAAISQETTATYKRLFPQDRVIRDVRRQMEQHIKKAEQGNSGTSFLYLLAHVGQKINDANRGKPAPSVNPVRMSYDEAQGDIRVDLVADSYAVLDGLKNQVQSIPLNIEISSASQDGDKIKARVRVWSEAK